MYFPTFGIIFRNGIWQQDSLVLNLWLREGHRAVNLAQTFTFICLAIGEQPIESRHLQNGPFLSIGHGGGIENSVNTTQHHYNKALIVSIVSIVSIVTILSIVSIVSLSTYWKCPHNLRALPDPRPYCGPVEVLADCWLRMVFSGHLFAWGVDSLKLWNKI